MERLELALGGLVFDAVADGPPDGPLVLLLHGFPQSARTWRHQVPVLAAAGFRAVAPDQRGYSPRARPAGVEAYRVAHLTDDVLGMADALGAERFHLVGHDWGGAVAWQVAGRHPDRLATLTVVSTPHPSAMARSIREGEQRERSAYMLFLRSDGAEDALLADGAALLRLALEHSGMDPCDATAYTALMRERSALTGALNWYRAAGQGLTEGLGPIVTPTLYVWSTDDVALGREAAEATAGHVAGDYRFVVLDGVSHWISEAAPEALNRVLLEHLAPSGRAA